MAPEDMGSKRLRRTRVGALWTSVAVSAVVVLLLLIFILQNQQAVQVSYFRGSGTLPLGVAVLLAAVGGALAVVALGAARIVQPKVAERKQRKRIDRIPSDPGRHT